MWTWKKMCSFLALISVLIVIHSNGFTADSYSIDVNCTLKPGGSEEAAIKKFKEIVEKESGGRIKVKMFLSGQLGTDPGVTELLKIGQTHMQLSGGTFGAKYIPEYDAFSIPFYIPTWECIKAYLEGPMGKKMQEQLIAKAGVVYFVPQKRGVRQITSNRRVIEPDDFKGLKMRVPEGRVWIEIFRELGTHTVVVPGPETYLALKTGQAEAQENSLVGPYTRKYYEIQKYIIMTNHMIWPYHWLASKVWFDKLSPEDQKLIRQAVGIAAEEGNKVEDQMDDFYLKELQKKGMEIVKPNVKAIREKAMPAVKRIVSNLASGVDEAVAACK